jgi:predicted AAA+ superfamily ATPase
MMRPNYTLSRPTVSRVTSALQIHDKIAILHNAHPQRTVRFMIPRALTATVLRLARGFPVVVVTGPRQAGKTTLVRAAFPDKPYVSMEDPDVRQYATEDARGFLAGYPDGAVFDEAQRVPDLLSYLQGMVDADRRGGRFILTGSQNFALSHAISQSLAGRAGIAQLLPLSAVELDAAHLLEMDLPNYGIARSTHGTGLPAMWPPILSAMFAT